MKLSARKQVLLALVGALVVHVVLILSVSVATMYWPTTPLEGTAAPSPIRLSIEREEPTPEPQLLTAARPTPPPYATTLDRQRSDQPPDEAAFQSDKDTQAASELAAQNNENRFMPSQEGREMPHFTFDTQDYALGEASDSAGQNAASAPPAPEPPPEPPPPQQQPERTAAAQPQSRTTPTPAPPAPTPVPPKVESTEFAMLAPAPTPSPTPSAAPTVDPRQVSPPKPEPILSLARPRAQAPAPPTNPGNPGYKPQTIKARIAGGINKVGPSSVAARDTPLGRYTKAMQDAIGSRWFFYMDQQRGLVPFGTVRLSFVVTADGKVHNIRVIEGNNNGTLATISISAVSEASIPPMPPDLAATLEGGRIEVTLFDFAQL